ncbi:MAG: cupin domain-containing protein [Gaiellaceae bacterium]|jgi:quercetin dioxygenase-like cupin family protein
MSAATIIKTTTQRTHAYTRACMSAFANVGTLGPQDIWNGVSVRAVHGERITLGVVELDANALVPEHSHENEQLGIVLQGSMTFRVGDESRELGPGGTWNIPANVPHEVTAGPEGAVVLDVFAPIRDDWSQFEPQAPREPRWP